MLILAIISRSGYLHHRLPGWSAPAIAISRHYLSKAQRDKMLRELKLANAAITDMQMRQRDVAALDGKIHEVELADAKAENDALRDDVAAGRRRLHIKAVCQSVREATTTGADNAALPDWQTPLNGIISPSERGWITSAKQLEAGTQKYINEQDRVAHIDGQPMQLL